MEEFWCCDGRPGLAGNFSAENLVFLKLLFGGFVIICYPELKYTTFDGYKIFNGSSRGGGKIEGEVRLTLPGGDDTTAAATLILDVATPKTPSSSGIG